MGEKREIFSLKRIFSFGIFGEPAAADAFLLFENLADAPQGGEAGYAENDGPEKVVDFPRQEAAHKADNQKCPPDAYAEIVFAFDDKGMEHADDEKCAESDEESCHVVCRKKIYHNAIR